MARAARDRAEGGAGALRERAPGGIIRRPEEVADQHVERRPPARGAGRDAVEMICEELAAHDGVEAARELHKDPHARVHIR